MFALYLYILYIKNKHYLYSVYNNNNNDGTTASLLLLNRIWFEFVGCHSIPLFTTYTHIYVYIFIISQTHNNVDDDGYTLNLKQTYIHNSQLTFHIDIRVTIGIALFFFFHCFYYLLSIVYRMMNQRRGRKTE